MINRCFVSLIFALLCVNTSAQNMQLLYDFDQLPQTLLLNPGTEVDYKMHFGVPFLSNVYGMAGSSNRDVSYNSLTEGADSTVDILRNLQTLGLGAEDILLFNQQVEFFNAGLRLRNPSYYLSFGMYQQTEGFSSYPPDFADLFFKGDDQDGDGSPEFGENYQASDVNAVFELIGVFHVGINKKINDRLTAGVRLKVLSGSIGFESTSNKGTYYLSLEPSSDTPYVHNFENMDLQLNNAGLLDPADLSTEIGSPSELAAGLFFVNGSVGAAIDLGFTYKLNKDLIFSGSILDIGLLSFNHKIATLDFYDEAILSPEYYDPAGGEPDFWRNLYTSEELPLVTREQGFSYFRSPKLNMSVKRTMERRTKAGSSVFRNVYCDTGISGDILESAYGLQVYTAFRPKYPVWALTGFYSRELTRFLSVKGTYTIDKFSFYNIGVAVSAHIKRFNFYMAADNLVALPSVKNSNYQSFQFGLNFIFNNRL